MKDSYFEINFDVKRKACGNNFFADGVDIRLANFGLIALFTECKLTSSSGKEK